MPEVVFPRNLPELVSRAENLPTVPAVALEALRLTQDDESTLDDLARVLEQDPALAAKLLKLANSSLFHLGQDVTSLQRAVMVLGMKTVKLMSLSFSLVSELPSGSAPAGGPETFDLAGYWRRSLVAAVAGRSFARLVRSKLGDEAFLCGILSHLGQLVLARSLPDDYAEVLRASRGWPNLRTEERTLGFHHADVSGALLREWGLPDSLVVPVSFAFRLHELPDGVDGDTRELAFHVAVAGLAVSVLCDTDRARPLAKLYQLAKQRFGVTRREVDVFLVGLQTGVAETASMLEVPVPRGRDARQILDVARRQILQIGLGTTVDLRLAERRAQDLRELNRSLLDRARTDALTGMANRACFDEVLEEEISSRLGGLRPRSLGVALLDIDHFKRFNDTHGHAAGDAVLREVGGVLKRLTRGGDLIARYGGEEFALLLPDTTPRHLAEVLERLRAGIEERVVEFEGARLQVTASLGGACLAEANAPADGAALMRVADEHLYRAKKAGRNRCEVHPRTELPGRD